ncbi:MAG TPA: 6-phosphogluconolactonase [Solirubrobacteraceae bacterium]|jgi:6-phosphogluconolactonase|nr:6-phosphogluconolactonase [Solirubrobacteraceae bacterium]
MRLTTVADSEAAASYAADALARDISAARADRGVAHIALAGGTTPRRTYELLAARLADWSAVELWFGDERSVGPEDPDSNYRMVAESLLALADVRSEQVHRIPGELGPDPAATVYSQELRSRIDGPESELPRLDVALLGLGEDGHTASLFPGAPELEVRGVPCVGVHNAPKPPPERITLTLDMLGAAGRCLMLATGASKAAAVSAVRAGPDPRVPASLLRGTTLELIVDAAAAGAPE